MLCEVVGIGDAGVFWFRLGFWDGFSSLFSYSLLSVFLSNLLAELFVLLFSLTSWLAPSLVSLFLVLTA